MPIRINLLAEAQAAEEARRKDPVKRTILVGVGLVAAMVMWMAMLMLQTRGAREDLARESRRLADVQPSYLVVSNDNRVALELNRKADALVKYATNRFLWGTFLDAFQHATTSNIWVAQLSSLQAYSTNKDFKVETNLTILLKEPRKWYQLWAKDTGTNVQAVITNVSFALTNRREFMTGGVPVVLRNQLLTNQDRSEVSGKLIAIRPLATLETITVNISGRDFSPNYGSSIDAFTNAILTNPLLGGLFANTSLDPDVRPRSDPGDHHNTNTYVGFRLKTTLPVRARAD